MVLCLALENEFGLDRLCTFSPKIGGGGGAPVIAQVFIAVAFSPLLRCSVYNKLKVKT